MVNNVDSEKEHAVLKASKNLFWGMYFHPSLQLHG